MLGLVADARGWCGNRTEPESMEAPEVSPGSGKFDPLKLVRDRGVLSGRLDAVTLPRVAELLIEDSAPVTWRIEGTTDAVGRPALAIALDGVLPLECQRCLEVVHWPVSQRTELLLARTDAELARLDGESELEVVLAQGPLDPLALVEDELVLATPFAPRHTECPTPDQPEGGRGEMSKI
jgi:uncharacterized protein